MNVTYYAHKGLSSDKNYSIGNCSGEVLQVSFQHGLPFIKINEEQGWVPVHDKQTLIQLIYTLTLSKEVSDEVGKSLYKAG